ncbi:MAG: hypothetical protein AAFQ13_08065, partial [Pseudomonadota bacterium]
MTNTLPRLAAFGALGLVLAVLLLLQALSVASTRANPEVAVALNGWNGLALEQRAARQFSEAAREGAAAEGTA